ncbi:hypothetical protein F5882DRAFT_417601 [Hyaloscypha sp. PMI_1271]|nr:hypothetical protein F5882DRAFT_417601 [Hyaloscypha sp. PMI_1271]
MKALHLIYSIHTCRQSLRCHRRSLIRTKEPRKTRSLVHSQSHFTTHCYYLPLSPASSWDSTLPSPLRPTPRMDISGGWSLSAPNCPVGTGKCDMGAFCCPNSLNCMNSGDAIAEVCCPGEDACVGPLEIGPPVCADPSWSLWNATKATSTSFNYFCCLGSQIGLQSGECGLALLIGPPPTNVAVPVCWNSSHQPAILPRPIAPVLPKPQFARCT